MLQHDVADIASASNCVIDFEANRGCNCLHANPCRIRQLDVKLSSSCAVSGTWNNYYNDLEHCGLDGMTPNEMLALKVPDVVA